MDVLNPALRGFQRFPISALDDFEVERPTQQSSPALRAPTVGDIENRCKPEISYIYQSLLRYIEKLRFNRGFSSLYSSKLALLNGDKL